MADSFIPESFREVAIMLQGIAEDVTEIKARQAEAAIEREQEKREKESSNSKIKFTIFASLISPVIVSIIVNSQMIGK